MRVRRIAVVGLGLAGSNLAAWLSLLGFEGELRLFDHQARYSKPCGSVVLPKGLEHSAVEPEVLNEVREYEVRVNGRTVAVLSLPKGERWLVVDKEGLVEALRKSCPCRITNALARPEHLVNSYDLVVDARGPFSDNGLRKLRVARLLARPHEPPSDRVVLDFDAYNLGLLWVFPMGGVLNVGYGAVFVKNPVKALVERAKRLRLGDVDKRSVRTSLVTADAPVSEHALLRRLAGLVRVGEAAGLVMPLGGEGNRPALLHSNALAEMLTSGSRRLENALRRLRAEFLKQALVLRAVKGPLRGGLLAAMMGRASRAFYLELLRGRLALPALLAGYTLPRWPVPKQLSILS